MQLASNLVALLLAALLPLAWCAVKPIYHPPEYTFVPANKPFLRFVGRDIYPDEYVEVAAKVGPSNYSVFVDTDATFTATKQSGFAYYNDQTHPTLGLTGTSVALTVLQPCTIDQLHLHPFSPEIMFIQKGKVFAGSIEPVTDKLFTYALESDTFFWAAQGQYTFQANVECEEARFVSVFTTPRPGRVDATDPFKGNRWEITNVFNLPGSFSQYAELIADLADKQKVDLLGPVDLARCKKRCGLA